MKKTVVTVAALLFLFGCITLMGQDEKRVQDIEDISLEDLLNIEVVTAGRSSQTLSRAPATMLVITEHQILARGYKDLKDVFRDLPGFDISENNAGEVRTLVTARGILNNNKLMVLRDGKKLNSPGGELLVYGNNMPLFDIKKIEVIYGPSSAMYGADAFSGVVNLISKTPEDYQGHHVEADLSYGMSNTLDLAATAAYTFNSDISLIVSGRYFSSDGENVLKNFTSSEIFRVPSVYDELWGNQHDWEQPIKNNNVFARLKLGNLTLGFIREDANEPNGPATDVTQNGFNYVFDDSYIWHQQSNRIYLDHTLDKGSYSFHTSLTYADYRVTPDSGWIYSWGPQYKYAKTTSLKLEEQFNLTLTENTKLISGFMLEQVSCFPKTNNLNSQFEGNQLLDYVQYPDHPGLPEAYRNKTVYFGVFDYQNLGLFSELTHSFSRKVQVNVGVRYDYNSDYGDVVNPRAGLIWDISEKTNLKLLYGKAYIAPSKYMAFEHWSAGGAFGFYPNPDLAPERLDSISLNLRQMVNPNFAVTLNTYYNMLKDLIGQSGYPWITNVNADEAVTYGCELMFDYNRENLSAFLHYSFLNAEMEDGSPISKVSDHKINAGLSLTLKKLTLTPRVRWVSDIRKIPSPGFDASENMDGHIVFDLSLRASNLFRNVDLYLTGVNLFNAAYFAAAPYGEGPSGWVMDKAPQPGLSIVAGLRIRL